MRFIILNMCLVLCLFWVGAFPLNAASVTSGVVPSVIPLFPTPVGVEPNLQGNVQHQGESVFAGSEQDPEQVPNENVETEPTGVGVGKSRVDESISASRGSYAVWGILLGVLCLLGLGLWRVYRKRIGTI
ncbi:MAG: hypothetical protein KBD66_02705 [Candidatus Doudnabacteria bacterium]|nr:hypothetical protein [Candidatus Doudnabacteria bacterium]